MASSSVQEYLGPALTRLERLETKAKELSAFPQRLEQVRTAGESTRKLLQRVESITIATSRLVWWLDQNISIKTSFRDMADQPLTDAARATLREEWRRRMSG